MIPTVGELLWSHRTTNHTADWNGSPDPKDWRNIKTACTCGEPLEIPHIPVTHQNEHIAHGLHVTAMVEAWHAEKIQAVWADLAIRVFFIPTQYEEDGLLYAEHVREALGATEEATHG